MVTYQTPERIELKFKAIKEQPRFWKNKSVLDIGCNEALLYPILKEQGIRYYAGIDTSQEYINAGKARFPELDLSVADLREFDRMFDIVIALSTLHIFNNAEFDRILKHYSELTKFMIVECPVWKPIDYEPKIYYVRPEWFIGYTASKYFKHVVCYGVSPSPHDPKAVRKVFKFSHSGRR